VINWSFLKSRKREKMTMINMQIAFNLFDSVVFQLYAPHSGGLEKVLLFFSEKKTGSNTPEG
jgi:hypothetical protein